MNSRRAQKKQYKEEAIKDFSYPIRNSTTSPNEIKLHISVDPFDYVRASEIIETHLKLYRNYINSAKRMEPAIVYDKKRQMEGGRIVVHGIPRFATRGSFLNTKDFNDYYNHYLSQIEHCVLDSQWTIYLPPQNVDTQEISKLIATLSDLLQKAGIASSQHSVADEPIDQYFSIRCECFDGQYTRYDHVTPEQKKLQRSHPLLKEIQDQVAAISTSPYYLFLRDVDTLRKYIPNKFKTNPLTQSKKQILDNFYEYANSPENRLKTPQEIIDAWVSSYPNFNPLVELNRQRRDHLFASIFNPTYTHSIQTLMKYAGKETIINMMRDPRHNNRFTETDSLLDTGVKP